jgi:formylmethanofuran dehydrogenase subunit B
MRSLRNVACPGCECVCDDIGLTVVDGRLTAVEHVCAKGNRWFRSHAAPERPAAEIDGRSVALDEAVSRAAEHLRTAGAPLIYGLSRSAISGQRAAVALAERLGAIVDTTASLCHGSSSLAVQDAGEATCTLGEARNRADLVVFWGCQPGESHPRHAERYSVFPHGTFTPAGRSDRTVVMAGDSARVREWRLDAHGARPDLVVPFERGGDFEAASALRRLLRDDPSTDASVELRQLMTLMRRCRYGIVFYGQEREETSGGQRACVLALLTLVAELNRVTRFAARRMSWQGDVLGAHNVLCWQTGYPFAVDFSRGYPRFNPGEFSANDLLERHDVDVCLLVGSETVSLLSPAASGWLRSIPTITLDYPGSPAPFTPSVAFTTAAYGLHAPGTMFRMDTVPIALGSPLPSTWPTDEAVLTRILSVCG